MLFWSWRQFLSSRYKKTSGGGVQPVNRVFLKYASFGNKQPKIKLFSLIFAACAKCTNHCSAVVRRQLVSSGGIWLVECRHNMLPYHQHKDNISFRVNDFVIYNFRIIINLHPQLEMLSRNLFFFFFIYQNIYNQFSLRIFSNLIWRDTMTWIIIALYCQFQQKLRI